MQVTVTVIECLLHYHNG